LRVRLYWLENNIGYRFSVGLQCLIGIVRFFDAFFIARYTTDLIQQEPDVEKLKEVEGRLNAKDMCRDYGISNATYYDRQEIG